MEDPKRSEKITGTRSHGGRGSRTIWHIVAIATIVAVAIVAAILLLTGWPQSASENGPPLEQTPGAETELDPTPGQPEHVPEPPDPQ